MSKNTYDVILVWAGPLRLGSAQKGTRRVSLAFVERPARGGLWSRQPRPLAEVRP